MEQRNRTGAPVFTSTLLGVEARDVVVEARIAKGLPTFEVIGLPARLGRESRVRVQSGLGAQGFEIPKKNIVVNLAPGDLLKSGTSFDLAIALAILRAFGLLDVIELDDTLVLGELSLKGRLRPVRGTLAHLRSAVKRGVSRAIVPRASEAEAGLLSGVAELEVFAAEDVREVVDHLEGVSLLSQLSVAQPSAVKKCGEDMAAVRGQATTRRAMEIAAAGRHHVLMVGPPGSGKTMLARRLPGLLPRPNVRERLDIATIASAAGLGGGQVVGGRPFRAPHHTASAAAMVGGGEPIQPGEVTLAHGGVLFLDELPEFRRDVIETLRTTMETGIVAIARARQRVRMPAGPLMVAAMNPCPCGYQGDPERLCTCSPDRVDRYVSRISGPLLDRFDLHVRVPRVPTRELRRTQASEATDVVRERVQAARSFGEGRVNAHSPPARTFESAIHAVHPKALSLLDQAADALKLSARAYVKSLRVGRTIANLEASEIVHPRHLAEALQYRQLAGR